VCDVLEVKDPLRFAMETATKSIPIRAWNSADPTIFTAPRPPFLFSSLPSHRKVNASQLPPF
jgi:hypothetical protein